MSPGLLIGALLAVVLAGPARAGDDKEVGRIDGEPVSEAQFARFLARKYRHEALGKSLLEELRDRFLVAAAVARHRITTAPEEIDRAAAELDRRIKKETDGAESLESVLRRKGTSIREFRTYLTRLVQVRSVIRAERGLQDEASVADDDVRDWLVKRAEQAEIVSDPAKLPEGVYLQVGEDRVTEEQFGNEILASLGRADRARELDQLLRQQLLAKRLAANGITLTEQDLDAAIERERQQYAANPKAKGLRYEDILKQLGTSVAERRADPGFRSGAALLKLARKLFTDEQLERYYRDNPDRFGPTVRARHILARVKQPDNPFRGGATPEAALEKIQSLRRRLEAGEAFEDVARQASDDRSKFDGGDIGFIHRVGSTDPDFAAAAFSLEVGATSEPVRTAYGYHLIQVTEKKPAAPFAEVQGRILRARAGDWFREALEEAKLENSYAAGPPQENASNEPKADENRP